MKITIIRALIFIGQSHRENFRSNYLKPALEQDFVEMTIPNKPNSRLQCYRLTGKGVDRLKQLKGKSQIREYLCG